MTGAAAAQLIPLLVAPLLTRLYSPEAFGLFSLFVGIAAILSVAATGRYELAIMLPERKEDAIAIMVLASTFSILMSIVAVGIFMAFGDSVVDFVGSPNIVEWLLFLPLLMILMSMSQILMYWANRNQAYRLIATNSAVLQGVFAASAIGLGLSKALTGNGLIVGRLLGQGIAVTTLVWSLRKSFSNIATVGITARALTCAKKYYQFPLYNMPYSLTGVFSREFIILALTAFGFIKYAGLFALVRSVVFAPASFVSSTIGQVFFREAVGTIGSPRLERLTLIIMNGLVALTPLVILSAAWSSEIFAITFGEKWREAGKYAAVLATPAFLFMFTSWPERVFEVTQRQRVSFFIQLAFDCAGIALIVYALNEGVEPFQVIALFSGVQVTFHCAYLYAIFCVAGFNRMHYWVLLGKACGLAAITYACLIGIGTLVAAPMIQFLLGITLAASLGVILFSRTYSEYLRTAKPT